MLCVRFRLCRINFTLHCSDFDSRSLITLKNPGHDLHFRFRVTNTGSGARDLVGFGNVKVEVSSTRQIVMTQTTLTTLATLTTVATESLTSSVTTVGVGVSTSPDTSSMIVGSTTVTPTASSTSSTSTNENVVPDPSKPSSMLPIIIGASVGGGVLLIVVIVVIALVCRRKGRSSTDADDDDSGAGATSMKTTTTPGGDNHAQMSLQSTGSGASPRGNASASTFASAPGTLSTTESPSKRKHSKKKEIKDEDLVRLVCEDNSLLIIIICALKCAS